MGRQPQRRDRLIESARALFERAQNLRDAGREARSLVLSGRALEIFKALEGPATLDVANIELERSRAFHALGRFHEADASIRASLKIVRRRRGGGVVATLRHQAFMQAGHVSIALANYGRARRAFDVALRDAKEHSSLGVIALSQALNGLGIVSKYEGRFAEGEAHYKRALNALSRSKAAHAPLIATLLHNLGGLEHARGRFGTAEKWSRRGVALRERTRRRDAVALATDRAALAAILQARKKYVEAAQLYGRALRTLRRDLGPRHLEVAFNVAQLASLEGLRGRRAASERLFRQALPILKRTLGPLHPIVKQVTANWTARARPIDRLRTSHASSAPTRAR